MGLHTQYNPHPNSRLEKLLAHKLGKDPDGKRDVKATVTNQERKEFNELCNELGTTSNKALANCLRRCLQDQSILKPVEPESMMNDPSDGEYPETQTKRNLLRILEWKKKHGDGNQT